MSGTGEYARIAVIDDDVSFREALAGLIRSFGYVPETYDSADAFIACRARETYLCLLVDVQMRGMSGLDLLAWLGANGRRLHVVMISSDGNPVTRDHSLRLGAKHFLQKPFGAEVLAELLEDLFKPS